MAEQKIELGPQEGPQTQLLETQADIAIYGGAAGGGKTFGLLLDAVRHIENSKAGAVFFRRTSKQITNEGALWDETEKIFPLLNAEPKTSTLKWVFPSGYKISFKHLEHEKNVEDWQGSQIAVIYFDELTHFTEKQFWYMNSRNRTDSNIKPYIRASTNPKKNSWVRELIDWWIGKDGYPIKERAGVLRWYLRIDGRLEWADKKEDLLKLHPGKNPRSLTFIPSKLDDNKILMATNPEYKEILQSLPAKDQEELLYGNWNVEIKSGDYFKKHYFEEVDAHPPLVKITRAWDRAATEHRPGESGDPDYTVGLKLGVDKDGFYYILDIIRERLSAHKVEQLIRNTATQDGVKCVVKAFQDPGGAGKNEADIFRRLMAGFVIDIEKISVNKEIAAKAVSAQSEAGNIKMLSTCRNKDVFYDETKDFPEGRHDDIVDAFSSAFNYLALGPNPKYTKKMKDTRIDTIVNSRKRARPQW